MMNIIFLILLTAASFAKDLIGDPFMTPSGSLFPEESARLDQLNSLHTRSTASLKGPSFPPNNKWQIQNPKDDFLNLLKVYPGNLTYSTNVFELDAAGLAVGKSKFPFWSYHYLPLYKGGVAQRFLTKIFSEGEDWTKLYQEFQENPSAKMIAEDNVDTLSPIEKYEYLVGNTNFPITKGQWDEGVAAKAKYGIIPTWYGGCHGTAPASFRTERPEKGISLKSFDNKKDIIFYPSDIKALVSHAWATSTDESAMIGTRCNEVIMSTGRPSPNCNDVNPGAFHLTLTNLMGYHGEPFIIDTAESIQVWNRPLLSYKMTYFRPDTRNLTPNLKIAMLPRNKFTKDPYAFYRSPQAVAMVGVYVELLFGAGVKATDAPLNSSADDDFVTTAYWYDLEIDKLGNIVGGEWHEIFHPDFIWVVAPKMKPMTLADRQIGSGLATYDGKRPLTDKVIELAKKSSQTGELLFSILEKMVQLSRAD